MKQGIGDTEHQAAQDRGLRDLGGEVSPMVVLASGLKFPDYGAGRGNPGGAWAEMELGVWKVKVAGTLRQSMEEEVLLRERSRVLRRAPRVFSCSARVQKNYQWSGKKTAQRIKENNLCSSRRAGRVQVAISQNGKTSEFMGYLLERSVMGGHWSRNKGCADPTYQSLNTSLEKIRLGLSK